MRIKKFFDILSFPQLLVFIPGTVIEKIGSRVGYTRLRKFRNIMDLAERKGFTYYYHEKDLALQKEGVEIFLRKNGSDYDVFNQVFIKDEYQPVIDYLIDNNIQVDHIIDAGSNIGLTTVKLASIFSAAKIICMEPDPGNYSQLARNTWQFGDRVITLPEALWNKEEELTIDFGFRDGKDWSRSVTNKNVSGTTVKGISLNTLIKKYNLTRIDLLKIDIEGSETAVFGKESDLSFLDKVKMLAIEIHDEFNCRQPIYDVLRSRNFTIFNSVELTLAINNKL